MIQAVRFQTVGVMLAVAATVAPSRARAEPPVATQASAEPFPSATSPLPPVPQAPPSVPRAAYVAGGLAVVAAGVGAVFGALALSAKSNFERRPTQSEADAGNNDAAYCDASLGAAVLLGATSVALFFAEKDSRTDPGAPKASVATSPVTLTASPILAPHGAGAGVVLRF
jgi:hypothetical protein